MVAVVIAGIATWGYMLWLRSADYAAEAAEHRTRSWIHEQNRVGVLTSPPYLVDDPPRRRFHEEWMRYEDRLYRKYRFATFFPFLPVSADPPAPLDPYIDGPVKRRVLTKGRSRPWSWFYSP
jgi:hypothetical protein